MNGIDPSIRPLLDELAKQDGLPPNAIEDLEDVIRGSPYLANAMSFAFDNGTLNRLAISSRPNEGGSYVSYAGLINLDPSNFNTEQWPNKQQRLDNLTVYLGHETGHALLANAQGNQEKQLDKEIVAGITAASHAKTTANLTEPVARYMDYMRRNEAAAEMVGMNSLVSRTTDGGAHRFNRQDFLKRIEGSTLCVEGGVLAKGIHLPRDGIQTPGDSMSSPAIEAIAKCHSDRASNLGQHGDTGYRELYGATAIQTIHAAQQDYGFVHGKTRHVPDIALDMTKLQLDPRQLERAGLNLRGEGNVLSYIDISNGGHKSESVSHSRLSHRTETPPVEPDSKLGSPPGPSDKTETPSKEPGSALPSPPRPPMRADHHQHPDYPAFNAIRAAVRADGRWNDEQSDNVAADLLRAHKADPLSHRLDRVVVSNQTPTGEANVFAIYAPHGNRDPIFTSHVDANVSAQIPAQRNLDQVEQINQQQAQDRAQTQQQAETQTHSGARMGPSH